MQKQLPPHTERGFERGLARYIVSTVIVDQDNWEDLADALEDYQLRDWLPLCYKEYKLYNFVLLFQHLISEILGRGFILEKLSNEEGLRRAVIEKVKKKHKKIQIEAEQLIENELISDKLNLYTPHVLIYVAGCGLGDLIGMLRNHLKDIGHDLNDLSVKLNSFNSIRTEVVHTNFSSRIPDLKIEDGLELGQVIFQKLRDIHQEYLSENKPTHSPSSSIPLAL